MSSRPHGTAAIDRTPKEDVLVGGLSDWADASWVLVSVPDGLVEYALRRTFAIGLVAEIITEGLMVPGDVDAAGHHPWPHSPGDAVERIAREWMTDWLDAAPNPAAVVWLANTAAGDAIARRVLEREGHLVPEESG